MTEKQHSHVSVSTCSLADMGHRRDQQEDSLGYVNIPPSEKTVALHRGHLYVLADGVGGSKGGEIASSIAVQTIIENYYTVAGTTVESTLKNAILRAHERIRVESQKRKLPKMRTTVVCAVICGDRLTVAHLGDSRAYLLREGQLKRVTNDHSVVQELLDQDKLTEEEASHYPERNVITRALGSFSPIELEINTFPILAGDRVLLCSDGLHDELSDEQIESLLTESEAALSEPAGALSEPAGANPERAGTILVEQANLAGGKDNISLILTDVDEIKNAPGFRAYPHLPPIKFSHVKKFSHVSLAYIDPEAKEEQQNRTWWQRQQPGWVLAVTTMIFVAILILETLWVQNHYQTIQSNLSRTQTDIETIISKVDQNKYEDPQENLREDLMQARPQPEEEYNKPLIIPISAPASSTKTPKPSH